MNHWNILYPIHRASFIVQLNKQKIWLLITIFAGFFYSPHPLMCVHSMKDNCDGHWNESEQKENRFGIGRGSNAYAHRTAVLRSERLLYKRACSRRCVFTGRVVMLCLYRLSYDFPFERYRHHIRIRTAGRNVEGGKKANRFLFLSKNRLQINPFFVLYTNNYRVCIG